MEIKTSIDHNSNFTDDNAHQNDILSNHNNKLISDPCKLSEKVTKTRRKKALIDFDNLIFNIKDFIECTIESVLGRKLKKNQFVECTSLKKQIYNAFINEKSENNGQANQTLSNKSTLLTLCKIPTVFFNINSITDFKISQNDNNFPYLDVDNLHIKNSHDYVRLSNLESIDESLINNLNQDCTTFENIINYLVEKYHYLAKPQIGVIQFLNHLDKLNFDIIFVSENMALMKMLMHLHREFFDYNIELMHLCENSILETYQDEEVYIFSGNQKLSKCGFLFDKNKKSHEIIEIPELKDLDSKYKPLKSFYDIDWKAFSLQEPEKNIYNLPSRVLPIPLDLQSNQIDELKMWNSILFFCNDVIIKGIVIKGFGRGSSLLGIPTANLQLKSSSNFVGYPGIYFGYAMLKTQAANNELDHQKVYKSVISIGYNPYFENSSITIEPYLYGNFDRSLLGDEIILILVGIIRNESNFVDLGNMIRAIQYDYLVCNNLLDDRKLQFYTTKIQKFLQSSELS